MEYAEVSGNVSVALAVSCRVGFNHAIDVGQFRRELAKRGLYIVTRQEMVKWT